MIMFGASAARWRIAEAKRAGVNAYVTMPVSAKALLDRIVSVLAKQRSTAGLGTRGQASDSLIMV
jgi:AmiR/NasT family two-component response regulator